ncbi:MAG: CDP-glycerol glycerophosphotransferase family protein [Erysipelotrichaceae bacterium]
MSLAKLVLNLILGPIYFVTLFFPIKKNKIAFISLSCDRIQGDFKILSKKLEAKKEYQIEYVMIKFKRTIPGCFAYFVCLIKQVYHINTSHLVLLDSNNYAVVNFKKKDVKVIQVWHASGAIKKFGNDVDRSYQVKGYDYVLACADVWKPYYAQAFGVKEEQVISIGIPRTDRIFNKVRMRKYHQEIMDLYPQIKGKKVILYAPTFRGNVLNDYTYEKIDLSAMRKALGDEYCIIYKMHPLLKDPVLAQEPFIINAFDISIKRLFSVCDYLISDYSSIVFEYSLLNKPVLFYTPDLDEYKKEVGMYLDYENEMPGPICRSEKELIKAIKENHFDLSRINDFQKKFFKYLDGKSTKRVIDFIDKIMEEEVQ